MALGRPNEIESATTLLAEITEAKKLLAGLREVAEDEHAPDEDADKLEDALDVCAKFDEYAGQLKNRAQSFSDGADALAACDGFRADVAELTARIRGAAPSADV